MYQVRQMGQQEAQFFKEWAAREGWNPGLNDIDCFFPQDPNGFFAGFVNGAMVTTGSAIIYNDNFAFFGFLICHPDYRGEGYGLAITKERLTYVGDRCTGLDGVVDMQQKYRRNGFEIAFNNIRFEGMAPTKTTVDGNHRILDARQASASCLADYDAAHFPARRQAFLQRWIRQPGTTALIACDNASSDATVITDPKHIKGLIVCRPCMTGYKIGPLFSDDFDTANQLLSSVLCRISGQLFYLDITDDNADAHKLVDRWQMQKIFETARMYRNGKPQLPLDRIFGITTFELG
ncbi:Uncharacterised protein [BD1-7 clade bacterium]|uniref:N-acetyltransferase domain-containing protein n=1 Tax=BD1-7 clade bacterium TaxID=2029982 RepID=A0A5S9PMV6_9GAMM|nr:Uncharacterised protein [BD1-7 clade bacterium]CAA0105429.1 Uncharacterised protein [BD1-7 clade bacterium]